MAENEKKQGRGGALGAVSGFFKRTWKFLKDVKGELKKIVWPTTQTTFRNTGVVLAVVTVVCLFVFGLDTLFMNVLSLFMDLAK